MCYKELKTLDINQVIEDFFAYTLKEPPAYIAFIVICLGDTWNCPMVSTIMILRKLCLNCHNSGRNERLMS